MISAPATLIHPAEANASNTQSHKNEGLSEGEEREKTKCLSGFIFLCNQTTKFECYRYRVFGLPFGRKEVVEDIKPGTKLFLFDYELKRLYGVYEATTTGNLNLEPKAFGGKFPAQVKFRIFKECLPMLESSLRDVIKENYTGMKFKQELCETQVTKLISSFRPLHASQAPAINISLPGAEPPSVTVDQLNHIRRRPVMDVPNSAEVRYSHIQPLVGPQLALNVDYWEHGSYRREASSYYGAHPQPLFAEDVTRRVQDPSYSRYSAVERRAVHDEVTVSGRRYHQFPLLQSEAVYQNNVAAYNSNSTATDQYIPSALPTQPYASYHQFTHHSSNPSAQAQHTTSGSHQQVPAAYFPSQNEALHQDNVAPHNSNPTATDQYIPSALSTQPYASYHQFSDHSSNPPAAPASDSHQEVPAAYPPLQTEAQHQDSATQFNSNLMALAQYASSVLQTQVPVNYDQSSLPGTQYQYSADAYGSKTAAPVQYTTSVYQSQTQATYLPQQREALYQHNVAPYYSYPTVPAQYASIPQPQVSSTSFPLQNEALHQVNVAAYNSNPMVAADQYTPSGRQPEVLGHAVPPDGSAHIASYFPYSAADHPSR